MNDSIVQTRVDRRDLATLAVWFTKHGERPRTISELVRTAVETLSDYVTRNSDGEAFEDTADAMRVLSSLRLDRLNPSGRGRGNLVKNLQESGAGAEPMRATRADGVIHEYKEQRKERTEREIREALEELGMSEGAPVTSE